MKLSLKLEDDHQQNQNPVFKAKIPLIIFDQHFTSSLTATTTAPKDVSFSLSTNFPSGPSLKLTYTPSSSTTTMGVGTGSATVAAPFSLSLKSGLGLFGSPRDSPLMFSANFSLSTNNPSFSLHFKPQFGNFSFHRSAFSSNSKLHPSSGSHFVPETNLESGSPSNGEFVNGIASNVRSDGWQELKLEPCNDNVNVNGFQKPIAGNFNGGDADNGVGYASGSPLMLKSHKKGAFLPGVAVNARTTLPLTKRVMVNMRWGLNFDPDSGIKLPYLTLNKIGVERVEEANKVEEMHKNSNDNNAGDVELLKGMYFWMSGDLEVLEKENRDMMKSLEEMKSVVSDGISNGKSDGIGKKVLPTLGERSSEFERWKSKKNGGEGSEQRELKKNGVEGNEQREVKKPGKRESDVEAELQKAIKAAAP